MPSELRLPIEVLTRIGHFSTVNVKCALRSTCRALSRSIPEPWWIGLSDQSVVRPLCELRRAEKYVKEVSCERF